MLLDFSNFGLSMKRYVTSFTVLVLLTLATNYHSASAVEKDKTQQFSVVAYHVDLRQQIMPLSALKAMANELSEQGFNTIIMEWEATFPYQKHSIISNRYAYSRDEVKEFIAYSNQLNLDVIPLQQNMGHSEYILMHERYAYLRAEKRDLSQVDPTQIAAAKGLFEELISDMISLHPSKFIHIGGDETRLLDCARCLDAWGEYGEEKGKSKLYVDYMRMIADIAIKHGKVPLIWADMILAHPAAIAGMPEGVIYIDWNYGWKFDRFGENPADIIEKHGLTFWGATAMRSAPDDYHVTTWSKHMNNQGDYVKFARQSGFEGIVLTSWATSGQYGYEWFGSEVVELYPIRRTYPHSYPEDGYRMNVSAFVTAVKKIESADPKEFAREYAMQRFGISSEQGAELWSILSSDRLNNKVPVGSVALSGNSGLSAKKRNVKKTLSLVQDLQARLRQIIPVRNVKEFSHFTLQLDLREFYLSFRNVEDWVNSETFTDKDRAKATEQLQLLLDRANSLNERFFKLFEGAMYKSEIVQMNDARSKKILVLRQRLARQR